MHSINITSLHTLVFTAAMMGGPVLAQVSPMPGSSYINDLRYSGSGCPSETVATNISDDAQAMTVLFDSFVVSSDDEPDQHYGRKTCSLDVDLNTPAGWSFTVFNLDYRGYADLDAGFRGEQLVSYRLNSSSRHEFGQLILDGEFYDDYQFSTSLPLTSLDWSPCSQSESSQTLNIHTTIDVATSEWQTFTMSPSDSGFGGDRVWRHNHENRYAIAYLPSHRVRGSKEAKWKFDSLDAGSYRVSVNWEAHNFGTQNAMYSAFNGPRKIITQQVNQRQNPSGYIENGKKWQVLGELQLDAGYLQVTLTSGTGGWTVGDSVKIEKIDGGGRGGLMTVDSIDGELSQEFGLAWRRCESDSGSSSVSKTYTQLKAGTMDLIRERNGGDGNPAIQVFADELLGSGDVIKLVRAEGTSISRISGGRPVHQSACPQGWKLHFVNHYGEIISGVPDDLGSFSSGIAVPEGTQSAWMGFSDGAYFDNEGVRGLRSGSTDGCQFEFEIL